MTTPMFTQPTFAPQLTQKAFPLTNNATSGQTLQTGFMKWAPPYPTGASGPAYIQYLYNPSTVASDYNIASASAQAAYDFPNPGDAAVLAIPLSQTVQWSLMFDRTFEVWGSYDTAGIANGAGTTANGTLDPTQIGCQADVMAFMQFTGMFLQNQYTTNGQGGLTAAAAYNTSALGGAQTGIMQMIPCWAFFGSNSVANQLSYYGYINEWSCQYTQFSQYNVPIRCVISVNFTMLPTTTDTAAAPATSAGVTLPNGQAGPGATGGGPQPITGQG